MRLIRSAVATLFCGFALGACGGGGTTPAPAPTTTAVPTPTATPLRASYIFAGDANGKTTVEYGLTGTVPVATLSATGVPNAFAFDASGNIYVAFGAATVEEHAAGTHRLVRTISGFHHVNDIALDAKGVLYVVDGDLPGSLAPPEPSNLSKVLPGATAPSAVLLSFPYPASPSAATTILSTVVVDATGNVYVGGANEIYVFAPGATATTKTIAIAQAPTALAFDRSDNLFAYTPEVVGGENESNIYKVSPGAAAAVRLGSIDGSADITTPQSLAVDSAGDLYELNDPYGTYLGLVTAGSVVVSTATGPAAPDRTFNYPVALAVDPVKNLYVLDADSVMGVDPSPGKHVSQYAFSSATPTRTFESSGTAIGLSSVP